MSNIFQCLLHDEDRPQSQLCDVARVCQRFANLARPMIFDIFILHHAECDAENPAEVGDFDRVSRLTRTLRESPELQDLVRTIEISYHIIGRRRARDLDAYLV